MKEITKRGNSKVVATLKHLVGLIQASFTPTKSINNVIGVIGRGPRLAEISKAFSDLLLQVNPNDLLPDMHFEIKMTAAECALQLTWESKKTTDYVTLTIKQQDIEQTVTLEWQANTPEVELDEAPSTQGELKAAFVENLVTFVQSL